MKKNNNYNIRLNGGRILQVTIGQIYNGIGCCGITDGVHVNGELTEVNYNNNSVTLFSDKFGIPCMVDMRTLYSNSKY